MQDNIENTVTGEYYTVTSSVDTGDTGAGSTFVVIEITAFHAGLKVCTTKELRDTTFGHSGVHALDKKFIVDVFISWEQLDDVEFLSDVFKAQRVDVFKQLVSSLGKLHRMQDTVKALLEAGA